MRWIHRTVDVNDVILNSLGASLGLVVVFLLRSLRKPQPGALRGGD
jgi:glycopeptide antibiotics resistance protein